MSFLDIVLNYFDKLVEYYVGEHTDVLSEVRREVWYALLFLILPLFLRKAEVGGMKGSYNLVSRIQKVVSRARQWIVLSCFKQIKNLFEVVGFSDIIFLYSLRRITLGVVDWKRSLIHSWLGMKNYTITIFISGSTETYLVRMIIPISEGTCVILTECNLT